MNRRYRARQRAATVEPLHPLKVFERDDWTCRLCGGRIDQALKAPDPASPSVDHIVALVNGGAHSYDNVQATHRWCNEVKNSKSADEWLEIAAPRPLAIGAH